MDKTLNYMEEVSERTGISERTIIEALQNHAAPGGYGEGVVTDYAQEYGEPGYSARGPILLGNYWCHCSHGPDAEKENTRAAETGKAPHYLHGVDAHYPRVFRYLEEVGAETEWNDEWMIDYETGKAYRTSGDSYSWTPSVVMTDDGEWLTPDSDIEEWVEWALNDPTRCLLPRITSEDALRAAGWEEYVCDLENGWHPGQDADPNRVTADIHASRGDDTDIVFYLQGVGQFDMRFCAFVRAEEEMEEDE